MADLLSAEVTSHPGPFIGYQLLNIITSGMYDDPLMVYREYVQNAVDSIDLANQQGVLDRDQEAINMRIDGDSRSITIEDNGLGLPSRSALEVLLNLGSSPKDGTEQRGFRGIGRLGGLAYCDFLTFETRSANDDKVAVVEWDRRKLDAICAGPEKKQTLSEVVNQITKTYLREPLSDDPSHFFRAKMNNVRRFHSDRLMSVKVVRDYLSQVSPVSYDKDNFTYAQKIEEYFSNVPGFRNYRLTVNGKNVTRPYVDQIQISTNSDDRIRDAEPFELPGTEGPLARGWYAVMDYRGALPQAVAMRGIRVRQGNIQVGDEFFLAPLYLERRFATWTIGEIQISNHNIRPNARRDGFEQTPEYESFLEQSSVLGRFLSQQCRKSSGQRSRYQALARKIEDLESNLDNHLAFIDQEHQEQFLSSVRAKLENISLALKSAGNYDGLGDKYLELQTKTNLLVENGSFLNSCVDGRTIRHIDKVDIIAKIVKGLYLEYAKCQSAEDLIQRVLKPFIRPGQRKP
jgi:molecular chaperone HtpG